MINSRFEPRTFFRNPELLAVHIAASELFGLLRRSLDLPISWTALVFRRSGDRQVYRSGTIDGTDVEDVFFTRTGAVELQWIENEVTSADGFRFRFDISARVALLPEQGDILLFQKQVLANQRLATRADLSKYLQPTVRRTVAALADAKSAEWLADASSTGEIERAVRAELDGVCFASGLAIEGGPRVLVDCPAYRQVLKAQELSATRARELEAARPLREARAEAQRQHVDHLAGVLARLKDLSSADGGVSVAELIRTFSVKERAELYQSLFASVVPATRTKWVVVAAGDEVLFFEGHQFREPVRRLKLAGVAGPVRSVQAVNRDGTSVLWLGAATGVYRWPLDRVEPDCTYQVLQAPSVRGGFNSVIVVGDRLMAAHSELGLWEWKVSEAGAGRTLFESLTRGARAVRHLAVLEGQAYCAIDERVIRWPAGMNDAEWHSYEGAGATITSICPTTGALFAGTSEGDIWRWDEPGATRPERVYRGAGRAVESIAVQISHGIPRLFFSDTSICAQAQVVGDSYTCRYEAGGQTIRRIDVADDVIVATNEPRDRLMVWSLGQPDRPMAVVPVGAMVQRSIQDVCLIADADSTRAAT